MTSLYVEIEIEAPRARVWQILVTKARWLEWNTFLFDLDRSCPFAPGQRVQLGLRRLPREPASEFEAFVTVMEPERCLQWVSSLPGLRTETRFELQDIGRQRTKFWYQQLISGSLHRFFRPIFRQDERQGMQRLARELKLYAEGDRRRHIGKRPHS